MKNYLIKYIVPFCFLIYFTHVNAQEVVIQIPTKLEGCAGAAPMNAGANTVTANKKIPLQKGDDSGPSKMMAGGLLAWPLHMSADYEGISGVYSYFYVSNYVDQFSGDIFDPGSMGDWHCYEGGDARTYDDHNGDDIVPYPFPWQMMDDESVDVVAAAYGVVLDIFDGNTFYRNCDTPHVFIHNDTLVDGGYAGNYVMLQHFDANQTQTIYGHMKYGTLANLHVGDIVNQGDYLGKIGSSGNSSAPHLHFEVRQYFGGVGKWLVIDPWDDPGVYGETDCNPWLDESLWINQLPYFNKQLLRITTHDISPVYKDCSLYEAGSNEDVNIVNHFTPGSTIKIGIAFRDGAAGDHVDIDFYTSTGTLKDSINYDMTTSYPASNYYFTKSTLFWASDTYRIRVKYDGKTYDHYFTLGCSGDKVYSAAQSGHKGFISGGSINSTSTISGVSSNEILYEAETFVKLNVGFKATQNCQFRAQLDDCTIGGAKMVDEQTINDNDQFHVFPNPTDGIVNIYYETPTEGDMQIVIRNILGEIIYMSEAYKSSNQLSVAVNLINQPKGMYFVELHFNSTIETKKLILQ